MQTLPLQIQRRNSRRCRSRYGSLYGQGMNAGLEDVRVLFEILDSQVVYKTYDIAEKKARNKAREEALDVYTTQRAPDAAAINDLAFRNYEEMRSRVNHRFIK